LVPSWTSSAVPSTPSGPGWFSARLSIMKFVRPPGTKSGSSAASGIITTLFDFLVESTP
jgi:hypothetical protein